MDEPAWTIENEHLNRAAQVVTRHTWHTPLIPAPNIGARAWLKLETDQHTGSFKVRGALARLAALTPAERRATVVAASAGNHGIGLAFAAQRLGVKVRVFVAKRTPMVKRDAIAVAGAKVVVAEAEGYDEAERLAKEAAAESGAVFVSPFDDPWVAAGNGGTLGMEIFDAMSDVDAIVAPVGGGGLVAGLAAAKRRAGVEARIIGVQSEACPAMKRSLEEGHAIERMEGAETLAEGLEGGVTPTSFHHVREAVERIDLVSEEEIADAMRLAHTSMGITVEGSAATVIAWAKKHLADEPGEGHVVLVVTGRNVDEAVRRRIVGA